MQKNQNQTYTHRSLFWMDVTGRTKLFDATMAWSLMTATVESGDEIDSTGISDSWSGGVDLLQMRCWTLVLWK